MTNTNDLAEWIGHLSEKLAEEDAERDAVAREDQVFVLGGNAVESILAALRWAYRETTRIETYDELRLKIYPFAKLHCINTGCKFNMANANPGDKALCCAMKYIVIDKDGVCTSAAAIGAGQ